jgi:transcriptional regulator
MGKSKPDGLLGALELLVLKSLARGPMHGYAIATHIQRVSEDVLRVEEGSLYPALYRMESDGMIAAEWSTSETGRRARFYRLTPAGRKRLAEQEEQWRRSAQAIARVLKMA